MPRCRRCLIYAADDACRRAITPPLDAAAMMLLYASDVIDADMPFARHAAASSPLFLRRRHAFRRRHADVAFAAASMLIFLRHAFDAAAMIFSPLLAAMPFL